MRKLILFVLLMMIPVGLNAGWFCKKTQIASVDLDTSTYSSEDSLTIIDTWVPESMRLADFIAVRVVIDTTGDGGTGTGITLKAYPAWSATDTFTTKTKNMTLCETGDDGALNWATSTEDEAYISINWMNTTLNVTDPSCPIPQYILLTLTEDFADGSVTIWLMEYIKN